MTRQEVFEATGPTPGSHMTVKIGVKNDGTILAATADLQFEAGAFPGSPVGAAAMCVFASYDIPNQQIDGYDVVVNKPKTQAYRAPGSTNVAFATETVLNEIAEKLGIDPIDLRLKNVATKGTVRADGVTFPRIGAKEVLEAMRDHPHYSEVLDSPNKGRGRWNWLLVQRRLQVRSQHQRQPRRHDQPDGRLHRHRRYPRLRRYAGRRGAGHPRRGREPHRR